MNVRAVVSLLCVGVLSGCSMVGEGAARKSLANALEAHAETVRWGGVRGLENQKGRRVTDYDVRHVKFDDKDHSNATVRVEVQGYAYPRMALRTWWLEQKWAEKGDTWVVVSERELAASEAKKKPGGPSAVPNVSAMPSGGEGWKR
jgi:hypothetical protein